MELNPGSKLGPYEIISPLGKGGMGEVWLARDSRLGRDVAIKISDAQFSDRFEKEARAIAALNHPNICTLYDVGPNYLVMELIEGPTLGDRIHEGPIPLEEALTLARQIADALEAAHEKGIVHRDLKPGNIKIRPDGSVKVLDFGLAKDVFSESKLSSDSPTLMHLPTQMGVILGTAAYMAPEQARGKAVDKRADIWSFGVVLHEMLTGNRLFQGEDLTETLAAVVKSEPDISTVPPQVKRLLTKCLQKDPKKRLRDIGDVWDYLETGGTATPAQAASAPNKGWMVAAGVFALATAGLAFLAVSNLRETPPAAPPMQFEVAAPEKTVLDHWQAPSPDGKMIAFTTSGASENGGAQIWVRPLDTLQARPVAKWTSNPVPFWSPDSKFLAYHQDGKLKKVEISGGPPVSLCDVPRSFAGGAWSTEGVIVTGDRQGGLTRCSASGGNATPLTVLDAAKEEFSHGFPSFLPDGRHFLYLGRSRNPENSGIFTGTIDAAPGQQAAKKIVTTQSSAIYSAIQDTREGTRGLGFLLFLRESALLAQPFDTGKLGLAGEPVPLAEQVGEMTYGLSFFGLSNTGMLVYRRDSQDTKQLTWRDRDGKTLGTVGFPGGYRSLALSPDGKTVAVALSQRQNPDIWLLDLARGGNATRLTFDPVGAGYPVWSADGSRVLYFSMRPGGNGLYQKAANGAGEEVQIAKSISTLIPSDWSREDAGVLYTETSPKDRILTLPISGTGVAGGSPPAALFESASGYAQGRISPDGHWVAYMSLESGEAEIYVRPYPVIARSGKWLVSTVGGLDPVWRGDGKELFYRHRATITAVEITAAGPIFRAGAPRPLFDTNAAGARSYAWDVTADGKRFLLAEKSGTASQPLQVLLNWTALLKK